ncbi:type II restriction endonuclease [Metamycoplasma phocicerebrale]|uniref:Type II restriction endonuclease n=1 Tax=Metamycoplasma phocicerebrale TaxID=142649 RepID=A0A3T0TUB0_9BACT|nr:type II restriction endonuclease [Metamycoplasma phocicerebrale]AZZ65603.1 type II restriction endonuclease [Metamycoplasma phocicerebrale]
MLTEIFENIMEKRSFYSSSTEGQEFEQKFRNLIKKSYSEIIPGEYFKKGLIEITNLENNSNSIKIANQLPKIKNNILSKTSIELVSNPFENVKSHFVYQPYGSQNFPDFLIFTEKYIIPIETKFSKNEKGNKGIDSSRPMWNSNIPKMNAIYIYGVSNLDTTFFKGSDILNIDTNKILINYFEELDKNTEALDESLLNQKNNFGIYPYIRKAYEHKADKSTYLKNGKRTIESYFSENRKNREENVLNFLREIEK